MARSHSVLSPFLSAVSFWALITLTHAQSGPAPTVSDQLGIIPYQSYHGGDIDSVNLSSGKINIHIPLISYPQRGGLLKESFSYTGAGNSRSVKLVTPCFDFCPLYTWGGIASGSMMVVGDQPPLFAGATQTKAYVLPGGTQVYDYWGRLWTSDGASHLVGQTGGTWETTSTSLTNAQFRTIDGSGYSFSVDGSGNWTAFDSSGIKYAGGMSEDPNGNQITFSSTTNTITDTLGRNIPGPTNTTASDSSSCPQGGTLLPISSATIWTVPGLSGGSFQIKFCYVSITTNLPKYLTICGNSVQTGPYLGGYSLLQSIVFLANNTAWNFEYVDEDGTMNNGQPVNYGSLTKITMPTGGTISYAYIWACSGATDQGSRWASSRTVNDGTGSHTWNYAYTPGTATTVTDPLGNDVVHTFVSYGNGSLYETQAQYYQGAKASNVLLKTVATQYLSNVSQGAGGAASVFPSNVKTTWATGQVQQVTKSYDSGFSYFLSSANAYYGKVLSETDSDYGANAPGPTLRTTTTAYEFLQNSNYLNNNMLNLVGSVEILDGGANPLSYTYFYYDENTPTGSGVTEQHDSSPPAGIYRGNQTSVKHWLNSGTLTCPDGSSGGSNSYTLSKTTFYDTGKVSVAKDPCSHSTTYLYSSGSPYYGAYPTTVTNALLQSTTNVFDANTGLLTSTTDPNNLVTTYNYDSMWRLAQVNHPDGAVDTVTRQETTTPFTATATTQINSTKSKVQTNIFDGLGRVSQTQLTSDPQGIVYTDTTYDALGRVATVSNPYRGGTDPTSSPGITTYGYDPLSRKITETYPDSSVLTTAYCGPNTLVTDPTGKWRRSRVDGLGHLVEVDEPNSSTATVASTGCPGTGEPIWVTSYTNDPLGNLKQVVQNGSHTRTFTYDSLSRLLTSANPETGTITYTYNPDGTVLTKKDARAITSSYTYDALHRETGVTYSNGDPALTFTYDESNCLSLSACQNIGHRTSMTDGAGSEKWAYQVDKPNLRSIHKEQRTNNSSPSNITKTTTYYLDLAGNVTQIVYPTGRTVNYTYDAADRPSTAADSANGITYATDWKTPGSGCLANAVCYTPQGSVYNLSIGQTTSYNGFNISETFNNRLQPNEIKAGTALDITYSFVDPVSHHNSGNVYGVTNNLNSSRSQTFTYDQVNRIVSAGTTATTGTYCWGYLYSYDAWGNLLAQAGWSPTYNACTETTMGAVTADGNNHISGLSYDASGNTLSDGTHTYTWNGEGQLKTAAGFTYAYDGDGKRTAKIGSKLYWYSWGGETLSETDAGGNTLNDYIFFGGRRIALVPASGNALYYAGDDLGSSRVIVQSNGTLCYDTDFTPFGGERAYTSTCAQNYRFTGKERDTESGLDDFGARYSTPTMGRFISPDDGTDHDSANPQSCNRYSYVHNNPLRFTDPYGHSTQTASNGDVLAVYDDGDNGVYQHSDIDNRSDWDGSKLDSTDEGTNYMGETPRWDEFAAHDSAHPNGINGSHMGNARIHFGQSLDHDIAELNTLANTQSLGLTALFERNGKSFDIKTGPFADSGPGTGYLLNGTYQTIESAGNYLAGLNSQTGTFLGKHISPEMAQKLFGAYQQGGGGTSGLKAVMKTFVTGKEYPGTSGPYWGEVPYSGYAQQEGINAGAQK